MMFIKFFKFIGWVFLAILIINGVTVAYQGWRSDSAKVASADYLEDTLAEHRRLMIEMHKEFGNIDSHLKPPQIDQNQDPLPEERELLPIPLEEALSSQMADVYSARIQHIYESEPVDYSEVQRIFNNVFERQCQLTKAKVMYGTMGLKLPREIYLSYLDEPDDLNRRAAYMSWATTAVELRMQKDIFELARMVINSPDDPQIQDLQRALRESLSFAEKFPSSKDFYDQIKSDALGQDVYPILFGEG